MTTGGVTKVAVTPSCADSAAGSAAWLLTASCAEADPVDPNSTTATDATMLCVGGAETTVMGAPSAVPRAEPSEASLTALTALITSATGVLIGVPSAPVPELAMDTVIDTDCSRARRTRRSSVDDGAAHGSSTPISAASTLYSIASVCRKSSTSKTEQSSVRMI